MMHAGYPCMLFVPHFCISDMLVMRKTLRQRFMVEVPRARAKRYRRLLPSQLYASKNPGVHQLLSTLICLDETLRVPLSYSLSQARSVEALRTQYRTQNAHQQRSVTATSVTDKVDALLQFLQRQATVAQRSRTAPADAAPTGPASTDARASDAVPLPTLRDRCRWMWIASILHAAFTHPTFSELGRIGAGLLPRN